MDSGIISKSLAAIRKEPDEASEMINQLLFGETFYIIENYKGWLRIEDYSDGYQGWLDSRLAGNFDTSQTAERQLASKLFKARETNADFPVHLCPGSVLHGYKNGEFYCGNSKYTQIDNPFLEIPDNQAETAIKLAKTYVNAPYLWGGKSPFGIDCSGLVQVIFRLAGVTLPRDSKQQALKGSTVEFINHVKSADLAFFDNQEGIITHVGIITGTGHIIHSSGYVKIDKFDHQGIFDQHTNSYTHKLRVVKRVL
ncbi:MAG: NlpC/P60 family protein [Bacteroidales bacterium]